MTVSTAWQAELDAWLAPFLARLRRSEQRRWAPLFEIFTGDQCTVEVLTAVGTAKL